MTKLKTIYDNLKPEYKSVLNTNARKYSSAKRIKYALMSKIMWQELTMGQVSCVTTYCDIPTYDLSASDIMYGSKLLND